MTIYFANKKKALHLFNELKKIKDKMGLSRKY